MKRFCLCLAVLVCGVLVANAADKPILAWEFNKDGDTEKWYPAHALTPLTVAGGVLKTKAIAGDPYLISSRDNTFDIEANDFQYIEIRLKCDKDGGAEYFWAATTEGKDAGFVGGQERAFAVKGDGQFHVYRVYPVWQGHITRLRFDPVEDAAFEVDYIRVMQAPASKHEPTSPRWDFRTEGAGGFIPSSGCRTDSDAEGLKVTFDSENAILMSPTLDLSAGDFACATVHFTASAPMQFLLNWSESTDGNFPGCNVIPVDIAAGEDYLTIPFSEAPAWSGAVKRIGIGLVAKPDQTLTLHSLAFGKKPEGPAKLTIVSFGGERSICAVGETVKATLKLRNDGGAEATGIKVSLTPAAGLGAEMATGAPDVLAPGGTCEVNWPLKAAKTGAYPVAARATWGGMLKPAEASSELIVTTAIPEAGVTTRPTATVSAAAAIVANEKLRLLLIRDESGFARARLEMRDGDTYRTMAYLPYLARVAAGDDPAPVVVPFTKASVEGGTALRLVGERDGIEVAVRYAVKQDQPWIDVSYSVTAKRAVALKSFQGPWLWAGEGSFGDEQDHAIFPGVEWLVKGERSSSSLDIAPPMHTRFAPHPNLVTVPSMAIEKDHAIVGLMWDPLQKWDGKQTRPAAVFASPNFVERRRNHLMGLFLPSIPDYVEKNTLLAKKPYMLKPGAPLTLTASIYALPKTDVTQASTLWYDRFCGAGVVPSLPPKPRDYDATIDMCMKSYESVLWKPDVKAWMPVIGWAPGRDLGAASLYYAAAALDKGAPEAAAWRAKALDVGSNSGDITFALRGHGSPEGALGATLAAGQGGAAGQPAGARYAFHPEGSRKALGPDGGIAVGIAAGPVAGLADSALRTGDTETVQAVLKGLAFMDQFDVPRASQVWECPLHSPDILASGQACRAYLAGYRLTGEQKYLDRAIFWAKTGLPFVYAWRAPEMPQLMKYATIPIFGATFYSGSWFGVPVQWNGLDYAYGCLELAKYDKSFPWRQIGEGITISGMNMQSTRPKDYGTYTDNWNVVTNSECVGCMLSPGGIMSNVLRLRGLDAGAGVDGVATATGWIAVNGPGTVSEVALKEGTLTAKAGYFADEPGVVAIMPVSKPTAVTVDGKALTECTTGQPTIGQWRYAAQLGLVTINAQLNAKPVQVALSGVARRELVTTTTEWRFTEAGNALGWSAAHDLSEPVVADGAVKMSITGGDPYFVSPFFGVAAEKVTGFAIRARVSKPGGQFFWATDAGPIAPARSVEWGLPADGQFHEVTVDLTGHPEWHGVIKQLRVDFSGGPGDKAEIEWVKVVRK